MGLIVKRLGNKLKIELPLEPPNPSKSGKSHEIPSSHGVVMTGVEYKGKPIALVVNAFVYRNHGARKLKQSETEP